MKSRKERIDVLVVERGLAESRAKAQALILAGQVVVDDQRVDKPGSLVSVDAELRLKGEVLPYVSRGGLKLKAAIDRFGLEVSGKVGADIGASTGGFTDCLLQQGATRVHAINVGYGQLHEKLRQDPRVRSRERVNARYLTEEDLPEKVGVMVIDVSFISLTQVLPAALAFLEPGGLLVALVKPQIDAVTAFVREQGLTVRGVMNSPVPGPAGNVEALLVADQA